MDHADCDLGFLGREAFKIGLGADDGEGTLIDGRTVTQITGALKHGGLARVRQALDLGEDAGGIEIGLGRHARRAVADDAGAALGTYDGKQGRRWMGAAFGAAGDMHEGESARRQVRRKLGGEDARRDQPRCTGRRAGAGDDAPPEIARLDDEAESLSRSARGNGVSLAQWSEQ